MVAEATDFCVLESQDLAHPFNLKASPDTEQRVSRQEATSESEKATIDKGTEVVERFYFRVIQRVPVREPNTLWLQCNDVQEDEKGIEKGMTQRTLDQDQYK